MVEIFLVDTNIIINFLNGSTKDLEILSQNIIFISVITKIELISAPLKDDELVKIKTFIQNNLNLIYIDDIIAEKAAFLRRKFKLKTPHACLLYTSRCV